MPGVSGVTVVTTLVCSFYFACEAAGASRARHSLRLYVTGRKVHAQLGRIDAARSRGCGCGPRGLFEIRICDAAKEPVARMSEREIRGGIAFPDVASLIRATICLPHQPDGNEFCLRFANHKPSEKSEGLR